MFKCFLFKTQQLFSREQTPSAKHLTQDLQRSILENVEEKSKQMPRHNLGKGDPNGVCVEFLLRAICVGQGSDESCLPRHGVRLQGGGGSAPQGPVPTRVAEVLAAGKHPGLSGHCLQHVLGSTLLLQSCLWQTVGLQDRSPGPASPWRLLLSTLTERCTVTSEVSGSLGHCGCDLTPFSKGLEQL